MWGLVETAMFYLKKTQCIDLNEVGNSKSPYKSLKDTLAAPEGEGRVKSDARACAGSKAKFANV